MYDELPQLARDDTLRPAICVYSRVYWILVGWIHADLGVSVRCPSRFLRLCPRLSAIVILDVTRTGYNPLVECESILNFFESILNSPPRGPCAPVSSADVLEVGPASSCDVCLELRTASDCLWASRKMRRFPPQ